MDRRAPGVRVRGDRIQIDFYYRGIRCRETLPLRPTPANLQEAARKREAVLYAISNGSFEYLRFFPSSQAGRRLFRTAANITVGELLDRFLRTRERTIEFSTLGDYKCAVRYHLVPAFGKTPAADVRPSDIREWIGSLSISRKRINNILIPLRGAFHEAVLDGLLQSNPVAAIPNLTHRARDPEPFTLQEMHAILDACAGPERWLFQFAFWTGLRTSELIALNWWDVDLRNRFVMVRRAIVRRRQKDPKTSSGVRQVKLLPPAHKALEELRRLAPTLDSRVFLNPRTGQPWETDAQIRRTAWMHVLKRAGVRYRNPYQTRHTYASMMLSAGENPMWVAQQMGHRDWGMIRKVYGRWIPDADPTAGTKAQLLWSPGGHKEVASG